MLKLLFLLVITALIVLGRWNYQQTRRAADILTKLIQEDRTL
jgi:hypothetical protein